MDLITSRHNFYPVEGDDHSGPLGAHGIGEPCSAAMPVSWLPSTCHRRWVDPDHGACNPDKVLMALG
jgi:hypothetical protein